VTRVMLKTTLASEWSCYCLQTTEIPLVWTCFCLMRVHKAQVNSVDV